MEYEKVKELTYDKSGKYRWFINELNRSNVSQLMRCIRR